MEGRAGIALASNPRRYAREQGKSIQAAALRSRGKDPGHWRTHSGRLARLRLQWLWLPEHDQWTFREHGQRPGVHAALQRLDPGSPVLFRDRVRQEVPDLADRYVG